MRWESLSSKQLDGISRNTVVVLPTAAIEQHGPHLPVGTDSFIAEKISERLDAACKGHLLTLPVQRIGCSEHHMSFAGSLSFPHEVFAAAVMETIRSVVRHGYRRFLVLNAHGGNQSIGGVIAEKAAQQWPEAEIVFTSWWRPAAAKLKEIVEGDYPSVGHACEFETSLILAIEPALVDMAQARDDGIPQAAPQLRGDLLSAGSATLSRPFDRATRHGVFGRPTLASAEKGQRILQCVVEELRSLIESCWPDALS
jgi:creatinine amidohydrolase